MQRGSTLHAPPAEAITAEQSTSLQHTKVSTQERQFKDFGPTGAQLALLIFSRSAQEVPAQKSEMCLEESVTWSMASQVFKLGW